MRQKNNYYIIKIYNILDTVTLTFWFIDFNLKKVNILNITLEHLLLKIISKNLNKNEVLLNY